MSKGPGRVERSVETAFRENPSSTFTVEELVPFVYPGANKIEKKHRVAILRAADRVAARNWWRGQRCERPGHAVVYYNLLDVRSYTLGRMRVDFISGRHPIAELSDAVDGQPTLHTSVREAADRAAPGRAWWLHVEINKAEHDGDAGRAAEMRSALDASIGALRAKLAVPGG